MQSKSLLIAIAAFAVTATGVHAYGGSQIMNRAGLSKVQKDAIEEAQELRAAGDHLAARDRLVEAGITDEHLLAIHRVASETRTALQEAVAKRDFAAFQRAVANLPLADIITSETDFEQFCDAHELRASGEWEQAKRLMDELGFDQGKGKGAFHGGTLVADLSDEQKEALRVARQSNDRATIQAIFDEAGFEHRHRNW